MFKYASVPKFTVMGNYCINVSLTDIEWHLNRYINSHDMKMNPDFQRGHVWTEDQQIKFVEFLLSGGYSGQDVYFNMKGWQGNYDGPMVLVDGLQRLTAAQRFVNNEIKVYGHYFREYDQIPDQVGFKFHINALETRKEVLTWYIQLNEGGVVHTEEELNRVKKLREEAE